MLYPLLDTLDAFDVIFSDDLLPDHSYFTDRLSQLKVDTTLPSVTIFPENHDLLCSTSCGISIDPSLSMTSHTMRPEYEEAKLAVSPQCIISTHRTIPDKLNDYRVLLSRLLASYRRGDLNGIPAFTNLLSSYEFSRVNSRFHFEANDLWTEASLDGCTYSSICDPPWTFDRHDFT